MKRGYEVYHSDLMGDIWMVVSELGVEELFLLKEHFEDYTLKHPELKRDENLCREVKKELDEYFKGERQSFNVKVASSGTPFRKKVWAELCHIPYGETISYAELAKRIESPKAVRAVGGANHANPLPIIVPCHRVIGKNGKLVGYMGDKTDIQAKLIAHEQKHKMNK